MSEPRYDWIGKSLQALISLKAIFGKNGGGLIRKNSFTSGGIPYNDVTINVERDTKLCSSEQADGICYMKKEFLNYETPEILPTEFYEPEVSGSYSINALIKGKLRKAEEANPSKKNCCVSCFNTSKIFTLIDNLKCAKIKLNIDLNNSEKPELLTIFGLKTKFEQIEGSFLRNLLCIKSSQNVYLIAFSDFDKEIKLIPFNFGKEVVLADLPDHINKKCTLENSMKKLIEIDEKYSVCLIQLSSIKIKTKDGLISFDEAFRLEIKKAFSESYLFGGAFPNVKEVLKRKVDPNEKKKKAKEVKKEKKKEEVKKDETSWMPDSSIVVGLTLCTIGTLFLVFREYSVSNNEKRPDLVSIL